MCVRLPVKYTQKNFYPQCFMCRVMSQCGSVHKFKGLGEGIAKPTLTFQNVHTHGH
jgi:hypothetical protein